jgi:predicted acyl esterase
VIVERDIRVQMRDGVALTVDVFRPDDGTPVPALLAISPYGKEMQTLPLPPQPHFSPVYHRGIEAGDPTFLTDHGYVHVIADVRGTGTAEGDYRGWMSGQEADDGYDLVEWAAAQEWCDGNVGMVGVSYFGAIQLSVAATQPPHLRAIMPMNAPADFYREATYHGGILQTFFYLLYNTIAGRQVSVAAERMDAEELERTSAELAASALRLYPPLYNTAVNPGRLPGWFDVLAHPYDGPFYWERSPYRHYDRIKIPCYFSSGWWAYAHMHLRGAFQNYLGIDAPKKLFIEDMWAIEAPMPQEYNAEVVRWYDHWLKGRENGIMDEPPIRLFVMGEGRWRDEHEWPLARTEWTRYHLRGWGGLTPEPEPTHDRPDWFVQQPVDETAAISSLRYETAPLPQELELTGPIALTLYAAIDGGEDTNWIVALAAVGADGSEREFTRGFLKASHRALDPERSQPWLPFHPHLEREAVPQGEVVEYAIELSPASIVLPRGHRLRLSVTAADHALSPGQKLVLGPGHMPWHVGVDSPIVHRVYHDLERPSSLLLPVIPR